MPKLKPWRRPSTRGGHVAMLTACVGVPLLVQCAHPTSGAATPPPVSTVHQISKPMSNAGVSAAGTPLALVDTWNIPTDLQLDDTAPQPQNYALTLSVDPEPKRLLATDPSCRAYLRHRATPSSESCKVLLNAVFAEPAPERRDERLAIALEKCRSDYARHPRTIMQAIRAEIAPPQCAELLALDLLEDPPGDLDSELRDILHAQVIRHTLSSETQVAFERLTPLPNGVGLSRHMQRCLPRTCDTFKGRLSSPQSFTERPFTSWTSNANS